MDRLGGIFGSHGDEDEYEGFAAEDDDSDFAADAELPPSPVGQDERRMQVRAYNHWAAMLDDRNFPSVALLDPADLDDFGPYSVVLDFGGGIEDPAIRFLGDELARECDARGTIGHLSDIPGRSLLSRITDHYMQIIANQAPIGFEAEFVNQRGSAVLYRGILLPYSGDDETIDTILGVINWKELADQQTTDALMLEIDQALVGDRGAAGAVGDSPPLDLSDAWADAAEYDEEMSSEIDWNAAGSPLCRRGDPRNDTLDAASGTGDEPGEDWLEAGIDDEPVYMVDYGDHGPDDETDEDDVEDLVDPLADDSVGHGLSFLVARGERRKPIVDLTSFGSASAETADDETDADADTPAVPEPYEPEQEATPFVRAPVLAPSAANTHSDGETDQKPVSALRPDTVHSAAPGLHDTLALARELADLARSSEQRTRSALYRAVGCAYDVSLQAAQEPEEFAELIADSGLTGQERAPMTPVVKLVFGSDYDKTRVTEYAAVLAHAHRLGLAQGALAGFLEHSEGGLKGVVKAERAVRRAETSKPATPPRGGIRPALARKLRGIEAGVLEDIAPAGPEFALVMIRRTDRGELMVIGEVAEDARLIERAGRKLVA